MSNGSSGTRRAHSKSASAEALVYSALPDGLAHAAADPRLSEELALALLARRDVPDHALESLSKNVAVMKSRRVLLALVAHPRTPRFVSLPIVRRLYTFELMQLALTPTLAADLKLIAEETIITRLETLASGERLTLAKRASGRVAAALLSDPEERVVRAALENPQMTEAGVIKALMRLDASEGLIQVACRHSKWSLRRDVRVALLRNPHIPLAHALAFAQSLPAPLLRDVLLASRVSDKVKAYLLTQLESMPKKRRRAESLK
jgi:hypothetical protein